MKATGSCWMRFGGCVVAAMLALGSARAAGAGAGNDLSFNGTNACVNIGHGASLDVGNTLTVEAWIKAANLTNRYGIFSTRLNNAGGAFQLEVGPGSGGTNRLAVSGVGTWVAQTADNALRSNQWTHIAYTRTGISSNTHTLYVNGVAQALISNDAYGFTNNTSDKVIGSGSSGGQCFPGQLDELRVWNVARTQDQIRDAMHKTLNGNETGLVAYYKFDQVSGTTLPDLTANHNDGTLSNGPAWTVSTEPVPFFTAQNGTWTNAATWAAGQGVPSNAWSRVELDHAVNVPATTLLDLTLNYSNGVALAGNVTVSNAVTLTSGNLDLGGNVLTLGTNAALAETGGRCFGTNGTITTTRTLNAPSDPNIAGLGVGLTSTANLGATTITRGHAAHSGSAGGASIQRWFDISPATNTGLNATLVFHYLDAELNGNTESALGLYRSIDFGCTYAPRGGTVDPGANTLTLAGLAALNRWTASSTNMDLFVSQDGRELPAVTYGSVAWGDFDNDGKLDVLITGSSAAGRISRIYRNNGDGTFTDINAGLPGVQYSHASWCDYDNDGFLDFAITGLMNSQTNVTRIYHNNGNGTFTDINAGLPGLETSSVAWGDYDNDGKPDFMLTGYDKGASVARIYHNNGDGTFTDINAGLGRGNPALAAWGDYNNDGYLDLLTVGVQPSDGAHLYRNNGDGTFTDINDALSAAERGSAAWGDYDNDGRLDILLTDPMEAGAQTHVYHNNGNDTFTDPSNGLVSISFGCAAGGDFDNDGRLDVLIGGISAQDDNIGTIYRNNGDGTFTDIAANMPQMYVCSCAWGDYDNDGKLDLLFTGQDSSGKLVSNLYRNMGVTSNTPPAAPAHPSATIENGAVTLSWDAAVDSQTPSNGLSYNVRIGSSPGAANIMSGLSDLTTGLRRVQAIGNMGENRICRLALPRGHTYYWSVQAIDTALAGGAWSAEGSCAIPNIPVVSTSFVTNMTANSARSGGQVAAEGDAPVTSKGIVWNSTGNPTVSSYDGITTDGSGLGAFTSAMTGLSTGRIYYVRAYAISATGVFYGSQVSFVLRDAAAPMTPPGNALVFSGATQYVAIAPSAELNLTADHTLAVWFKTGATSGLQGLISKYQTANAMGWYLRLNGSEVEFDGLATTGLGLQSNVWYHLAGVKSGTNYTLYVNGAPVSLTGTGAVQMNGDPVYIGSDFGGRYFAGRLDEVGLWNIALSAQQVRETMHLTLDGTQSGLVAYYNMDQTAGPTLCDLSQSAAVHNGTLTNMTGTAWTASTIPAGSGVVNTQPEAAGPVNFAGTSLAMNYAAAGSATVTVTRIDNGPPHGMPAGTSDSPYWAVDRFGSGSFSANLTFTVAGGLNSVNEASPATVHLYTRATNSDGAWTKVADAAAVSAANQTATFNHITAFGQFLVAQDIMLLTAPTLPGNGDSAMAWGDYDNDGWLDLAIVGSEGSGIYHNNGDGSFTNSGASLITGADPAIGWADYDKDGYLDFAVYSETSGSNFVKLYHNNGDGTFTNSINLAVSAQFHPFMAWGDYDNDGYPDLAVGGQNTTLKIFHNNGNGTFTAITAGIPFDGNDTAAAWGDYDNDGYLDLVLQGGRLYHNNGNGTFTLNASAGLSANERGAIAWGDYNNDGWLDIVDTGELAGSNVYRNNHNGTFTRVATLTGNIDYGSVSLGDYDNDGSLDILVSSGTFEGMVSGIVKIFHNDGDDTFSDTGATLVQGSTEDNDHATFADYDNDGRLDVAVVQSSYQHATYLYRNIMLPCRNTPASAPGNLSAAVRVTNATVRLGWGAATDGQTPAAGLSYNLRVGTAPGAGNVVSGLADLTTGQRRIPALGNANANTNWTVRNLADGTYYWSVQAVDSALAGGAWAAERSFVMLNDSDGDGIPDYWALKYGLNPTNAATATNNADGDAFNNLQEYIADTDPTNPASYFHVTAVSNLPPWTVYFLSSTGRLYTLNAITNLVSGVWTNVPGAGPRLGAGGADTMRDTNMPPKGPFYRLKVTLP